MPTWTCPNTKCKYDDRLEDGEFCPLCGEKSQKFDFNEFGALLKTKDNFRKSVKKEEQKDLRRKVKFCPKCGSTNINFPIFYRPSIWKCLDCGYEGAFIVEDGKLREKIQEGNKVEGSET